jgi:hypothetical protein
MENTEISLKYLIEKNLNLKNLSLTKIILDKKINHKIFN